MRTQNRSFRLTAAVAVAGTAGCAGAAAARAGAGRTATAAQAGPRTSRAAIRRRGSAGWRSSAARCRSTPRTTTQWNPATLNYPVTQGNAFWTEPNAQAVIEVSASRIAMAPGTELDIATLTDTAFQATEPQGEVYLHVQAAAPDETYAVQTPRGLVTLAAPGRYGVVAGDTQNPTVVTVIEGSAQVEGPGVSLDVGANQTASITGTDTFQGEVGPAQRDAFLTAMLDRERPPQPQGVAPPPVVAAMPGGDDLARYGTWSADARTTARSGIRRWRRTGCRIGTAAGPMSRPGAGPGWTATRGASRRSTTAAGPRSADAGAGFPASRCGGYRPVYAPALVTFFGVGAAVGVGIGAALAAGRIGWLPLGPREPYPSLVSRQRPLLPPGQRRARDQHHHDQPRTSRSTTSPIAARRRWCRRSAMTASRPVAARSSGSIRRSSRRRGR